ncbi:hypothetical protein B0H14DRAFT_346546 [Mycena olivaceomarginata]|nr:hypothetical protein B0H14DRAFT_346546 [Mycena olivaceomarginata]
MLGGRERRRVLYWMALDELRPHWGLSHRSGSRPTRITQPTTSSGVVHTTSQGFLHTGQLSAGLNLACWAVGLTLQRSLRCFAGGAHRPLDVHPRADALGFPRAGPGARAAHPRLSIGRSHSTTPAQNHRSFVPLAYPAPAPAACTPAAREAPAASVLAPSVPACTGPRIPHLMTCSMTPVRTPPPQLHIHSVRPRPSHRHCSAFPHRHSLDSSPNLHARRRLALTHPHAQLSAPARRLLASPSRAAPVCCTIPCIAASRLLRFTRTSSPFRASRLVSCATRPRRRASPAPRTPYICLYFTLCAHPFIGRDVCRSSASISIVVFYLHPGPRMYFFCKNILP